MQIRIQVTPKARSNEIMGWEGNLLKIRLCAIPEKGKANEVLIEFLAETLGIRPSSIRLIRGQTSRTKDLIIEGIDETTLKERLLGSIKKVIT